MKTMRWSRTDGAGIEHLVLHEDAEGATIESVVAGENDSVMYRIECDARWHVTRVALRLAGGETLDLRSTSGSNGAKHASTAWTCSGAGLFRRIWR